MRQDGEKMRAIESKSLKPQDAIDLRPTASRVAVQIAKGVRVLAVVAEFLYRHRNDLPFSDSWGESVENAEFRPIPHTGDSDRQKTLWAEPAAIRDRPEDSPGPCRTVGQTRCGQPPQGMHRGGRRRHHNLWS
jgi:hypothetical protein